MTSGSLEFMQLESIDTMGLIMILIEPVGTWNSQNWGWSGIRNRRFEVP